MKDLPRMTARTGTYWRNAAGAVAICLAGAVFFAALWFRATYHFFPGMVPTVVHWCGRDYETGETWTWAQITSEEAPRKVRAVGSYPFLFPGAHTLFAAPIAGPVKPGEPCAMTVYIRTGPDRYRLYALEGGP
jgi:hypothetical protein